MQTFSAALGDIKMLKDNTMAALRALGKVNEPCEAVEAAISVLRAGLSATWTDSSEVAGSEEARRDNA